MKTCKCSTLPTAGFLSFLTTEVRELARILRPKIRLLARRLFLSGRGGRYGRVAGAAGVAPSSAAVWSRRRQDRGGGRSKKR